VEAGPVEPVNKVANIMAYSVRFDKAAAKEILEAIHGNKPILPAHDGWTVERMIAVAGAE